MAATGTRPPSRPWHATTRLDHFAIVSYAVDPRRLARCLPEGIEPDLLPVEAGTGRPTAVVSAVAARNHRFRFRGLPFVTLSAGQVDYRAYVTVGGEHGVWFFGASLDTPLVAVARRLWAMPWHRATVTVDGVWTGHEVERLSLSGDGAWGAADVALGPAGSQPDPLAPYGEVTDPLVGWYRAGDGDDVRRYSVWHPPLDLRPAAVERARFQVFTELGLVEPDQPPLSALVQRQVDLDVQTPPRRSRPPVATTEASGRTGAATPPHPRA